MLTENKDIADVRIYTSTDNSWDKGTVTWNTKPTKDLPVIFSQQLLLANTIQVFSLPTSVISGDGI